MSKKYSRITWIIIGIDLISLLLGLTFIILENTDIGVWILVGATGIVFLYCIWFIIKKPIDHSLCPRCGKAFSMKETSRKIISSYATTMKIQQQIKNASGEVVGTCKQTVPATRYLYDCVDECIFCGHRREVRRKAKYND